MHEPSLPLYRCRQQEPEHYINSRELSVEGFKSLQSTSEIAWTRLVPQVVTVRSDTLFCQWQTRLYGPRSQKGLGLRFAKALIVRHRASTCPLPPFALSSCRSRLRGFQVNRQIAETWEERTKTIVPCGRFGLPPNTALAALWTRQTSKRCLRRSRQR